MKTIKMKTIKAVIANTKPDPRGFYPQFTPKILREMAQTQGKIYLYLGSERAIKNLAGEVTRLFYDEGQEELIAEIVLVKEIPRGCFPALKYFWNFEEGDGRIVSIGCTQAPVKSGISFLNDQG